MAEKQDSSAPKILDTTEAPPIGWQPRVIEGGKPKEVKKDEKKSGGKTPPRRLGLKIGAGIGAGVLLGGGAAAYYIQHEQAQGGDQITQDEQGNPVAVITVPETTPSTTAAETVPPATETTPETTPSNPALEAILKEKVSFISEALYGARLDTKTGDLIAEDGNEWGIKEGEIIGCYVVKAFKMETADGVEKEQDAIGLIPKIIEAVQNKKLKEIKESFLPIPSNLKEVKDVKITELKIAPGDFEGVINLGMNVPVGTLIYAPRSSAWELSYLRDFWGGKTNDKTLFSSYDIDKDTWWQYYMRFNEGKIITDLDRVVETYIMEKDGKERAIPLDVYEVDLGEPMLEITGEASLDETANRINNLIYSYENPGEYQFYFGGFLSSSEGKIEPTKILELGKESQKVKVFIFPNETTHEQAN